MRPRSHTFPSPVRAAPVWGCVDRRQDVRRLRELLWEGRVEDAYHSAPDDMHAAIREQRSVPVQCSDGLFYQYVRFGDKKYDIFEESSDELFLQCAYYAVVEMLTLFDDLDTIVRFRPPIASAGIPSQ